MKTDAYLKRQKREQRIHDSYARLIAEPGAMKTACQSAVADKFGIDPKTVINIYKRVAARTAQPA